MKNRKIIIMVGASVLAFGLLGCGDKKDSEEEGTDLFHNGYGYNKVTSPYTDRVWLDRNVGASRRCVSITDSKCYGDYFQWGREADGHEKRNAEINSTASNTVLVNHSDFIAISDWTNTDNLGTIRQTNWNKTDGTSICPIGFRVPDNTELSNETLNPDIGPGVSNATETFNTFLRLPTAGYRITTGQFSSDPIPENGIVVNATFIWSTTVSSGSSRQFQFMDIQSLGDSNTNQTASLYNADRGDGASVRCIEELIEERDGGSKEVIKR